MRIILTLWFLPLVVFWGWFGLSYYDISFGTVFFSRELHDMILTIYSQQTGIAADQIPGIIAGACAFDSLIVLAVAAYRWRERWLPRARALFSRYWGLKEQDDFWFESAQSGRVPPAE